MRLIDLSTTLDRDEWAPRWGRNKIIYQDHKFGRRAIRMLLRLPSKYLREGLGWANEYIFMTTHGTTHVDAPIHYSPISEGKPSRTIDLMPLEWYYGDGVVLDMRHKQDCEVIMPDDLELALKKIGYVLKEKDIVLIRTGNDSMLGSRDYFYKGAGMGRDATLWLIDHGVRVMGIDSWGWDIPLPAQAKKAIKTKDPDLFWEAHYAGVDKEYSHIERLTNLGSLPSFGFKVACFPIKVKNGSAGPARVVAFLED